MSLLTKLFPSNRRSSLTKGARTQLHTNRFRPVVRELEERTVPASDSFLGATVLTGTLVTDTASNVGATAEPGEPNHAGTSGPASSVWWEWTAPASGRVEVNTNGSVLDTTLGVYTGTDVAALTLVGDNDDYYDFQSRVEFDAVAGTTYRIAVDGYAGGQGDIVLNLGMVAANDNFADAIVLTGTSVTTTGHVLAATGEPGEPDHGAKSFPISVPLTSVWWEWTAPADGPVVISTFGSDFDTTLAVYTGTDVAALTPVASNDDSGGLQSRVEFDAVAGTTYHIAVDGALQWTGLVRLNLDLDAPVPPPPPANNPPVMAEQSFSVDENSAAGTAVGTVVATDPDAGQTLTYSLVSVTANGSPVTSPFIIDSATGAVTVAPGSVLDFEANATYQLTVQVTDSGSPALNATATITVDLNNVNESPVNTVPAGQTGYENVPLTINGLAVSDPDAGSAPLSVTLSVGHGTLAVNPAVPGGLTTAGITGNGTPTVVLTGTAAQINATLAAGLTYLGAVGFSGSDSLTVFTSDLGNTGLGGVMTDTDAVTLTILSTLEQAQILKTEVLALLTDGTINSGEANSLLTKLELKDNSGDHCRIMTFIAKVNEFVFAGTLTEAEAAPLLALANNLLAGL